MYFYIYIILGCINFTLIFIFNKRLSLYTNPQRSLAKKVVSILKLILTLIILWPLFILIDYITYSKTNKLLKGKAKPFIVTFYTREL